MTTFVLGFTWTKCSSSLYVTSMTSSLMSRILSTVTLSFCNRLYTSAGSSTILVWLRLDLWANFPGEKMKRMIRIRTTWTYWFKIGSEYAPKERKKRWPLTPHTIETQLGQRSHAGVFLDVVGVETYTFVLVVVVYVPLLVFLGHAPFGVAARFLFQSEEPVDILRK